ncbi:MAG: SRPBCC family protein [Solirubrobacterales bacterium]
MPTIARSRAIGASAASIWSLIADPHNLPRWFPETDRVEDVEGGPGDRRARFTQVMTTRKGRTVRADYRCTAATAGRRLVWAQQLEGTPFEGFLRSAEIEIRLDDAGAGAETAVTVEARRRLRGVSRLGSMLMKRATGRTLETALDGIERAVARGAVSG